MSERCHVYSSCLARQAVESAPPLPGKNDSASACTECTSKMVPYASNTSADTSLAISIPFLPMLPFALRFPSTPNPMRRILAALALLAAFPLANAQTWPTKPVKIIVPFPAGGPTDVLTRVLGDKLAQALGQPVVVENKPGAGGSIGADLAAKSAPDGYTLVMATGSTHSVGPYLQKLAYDPAKDFTPIVYVGYA